MATPPTQDGRPILQVRPPTGGRQPHSVRMSEPPLCKSTSTSLEELDKASYIRRSEDEEA